jgi:two-component system OmpR family response regulator
MAAEEKRVYMLTPKGNAELTAGKSSLGGADLKLLVLVDGMVSVEDIAKRVPGKPAAADVAKALKALSRGGYIADPDGTAAIDVKAFFKDIDSSLQSLQANGFFVRIARRAEAPAKRPPGQKVTVMAVEDDPQLAKMLSMYLKMEDFNVRIAATRDEINKALREPPKPDLMLLDVVLPDADGFQILEKMRAHPQVKDVPIIMATAKASREAVMQGLQRGADGYVTKPYDMQVLMTAIKTVLGL